MIHFCFTHRGNHNQKKFMIIMLHILKGKKTSFLFAELSSTWWENKTTRQELPLILATDLPAEAILASPFLTATCEVISSHCQFQGIGFFLQPYRQPCYRPLLSPARVHIHCSPLLLHLLASPVYFTGFGYIRFIETSDYTICQYFLTLKFLTLTFFWNSDFYANIPSALVLLNSTKRFLLMLIFIFLYFFLWKIYFFHTICYDYSFIFSNFSEILSLALPFKFTPFLSLTRKQTSREQ